jgi:putative inorganic carbon (HCO3(-)) transporter
MRVYQRLRRIAWFEPFWVLAVGIGLLLPQRFLPAPQGPIAGLWRPLLIGLLLAGWAVRALAYGRLTRRTPLDWPLLFLILCVPVSLWASADRGVSWVAAGYLIFGLAVYFALVNWPPAARRPEIVAWALMGLGLAVALVAPLIGHLTAAQFSQFPLFGVVLGRIGQQPLEDVNVNVLAGSLVPILPLYVALALRHGWKRPWPAVFLVAGALGLLAVIVVTRSRGAYLAAAIGIAVVAVLRWPRLLCAVLVLLVAGIIGVCVIGPARSLEALSFNGALGGLSGRVEVWSRAILALRDFGITGIGIGTFSRVIPLMYPYVTLTQNFNVDHAHNLFLQVGLDLGIPGLIAYLAVLINTFVLLGSVLRRRVFRAGECTKTAMPFEDGAFPIWSMAAGAAGGLAAMLVHGIFDATMWNSRPAFVPWVLIALSVLVGTWGAFQDAARSGSTPDSLASTN